MTNLLLGCSIEQNLQGSVVRMCRKFEVIQVEEEIPDLIEFQLILHQ